MSPHLSKSPFYNNVEDITKVLTLFVRRRYDLKALQLLENIVRKEKKWRLELCVQLFGDAECSGGNLKQPRPGQMWQRKFITNLLKDPTDEIINRIRQNIEFF